MTSITVEDDGTRRVISDIAPLLAKQAEIVERLEQIYADYERRPAGALEPQEPVIVELVNRYHQLGGWIDQLETLSKRRANIDAGWALLGQIRGERP